MRSPLSLIPALALTLSGCLTGNGVPATRDFDVFGAQSLDHRTLLDLEVHPGPKARLSITCDENLLDVFEVRVEGETLIMDQDDRPIDPQVDCRGELELPALTRLDSGGSGRVDVVGPFAETALVAVSGSGSVRFREAVNDAAHLEVSGSGSLDIPSAYGCGVRLRISGSGSLTLDELRTETMAPCAARVELLGSGSATVQSLIAPATELSAQGSGSIRAAGQTGTLLVRVTGSGSVRAPDLVAESGDLESHGSGSIETTVTKSLRVRLTGSGDALVHGQPVLQDVTTTGSGRLRLR